MTSSVFLIYHLLKSSKLQRQVVQEYSNIVFRILEVAGEQVGRSIIDDLNTIRVTHKVNIFEQISSEHSIRASES